MMTMTMMMMIPNTDHFFVNFIDIFIVYPGTEESDEYDDNDNEDDELDDKNNDNDNDNDNDDDDTY